MTAKVGEIVNYRLSREDTAVISSDRASDVEAGPARRHNPVRPGEVYPAMVVRTWESDGPVNLHVLLDGNDSYWATSRVEGDDPGQWSRMEG